MNMNPDYISNLDYIDEPSIKLLVDCFYSKVRKDPKLGPIFINAIGETDEEWQRHLETLYAFWSSLMLTSGRYHGRPVPKHKALPPFPANLFDQWLHLFEETAYQIHTTNIARQYIMKARRVAESLKFALYFNIEDIAPKG